LAKNDFYLPVIDSWYHGEFDYTNNWETAYDIEYNNYVLAKFPKNNKRQPKDKLRKDFFTKLVCTNEKRVRDIVGGLFVEQEVEFEYAKKGISCFVNRLEYRKQKRTIIVNKRFFIGHIPFSKTALIKNNKNNIKEIEIFDIKEKYKNQKAIIIKIEFLEGVKIDG
jgi:hypothetical protein